MTESECNNKVYNAVQKVIDMACQWLMSNKDRYIETNDVKGCEDCKRCVKGVACELVSDLRKAIEPSSETISVKDIKKVLVLEEKSYMSRIVDNGLESDGSKFIQDYFNEYEDVLLKEKAEYIKEHWNDLC